jgi:hypothetical protein
MGVAKSPQRPVWGATPKEQNGGGRNHPIPAGQTHSIPTALKGGSTTPKSPQRKKLRFWPSRVAEPTPRPLGIL